MGQGTSSLTNSWACQVQLDNQTIYPGQTLSGTISSVITEYMQSFNYLKVCVIGNIQTEIKEEQTNSKTDFTHTHRHRQRQDFLRQEVPIVVGELYPGQFQRRFEVTLPQSLPPTVDYNHGNLQAKIEYKVQVLVAIGEGAFQVFAPITSSPDPVEIFKDEELVGNASAARAHQPHFNPQLQLGIGNMFTDRGHPHLNPQLQLRIGNVFSQQVNQNPWLQVRVGGGGCVRPAHAHVLVNAKLDKRYAYTGDTVQVTYDAQNQSQLQITKLEVYLKQSVRVRAHSQEKRDITRYSHETIQRLFTQHISMPLQIQVPHVLTLPTIQTFLFSCDYEIVISFETRCGQGCTMTVPLDVYCKPMTMGYTTRQTMYGYQPDLQNIVQGVPMY